MKVKLKMKITEERNVELSELEANCILDAVTEKHTPERGHREMPAVPASVCRRMSQLLVEFAEQRKRRQALIDSLTEYELEEIEIRRANRGRRDP